MHIILLENKPAETWNVSSSDWVRWRESAPIFKAPHGETRLRMSFEWKDQGYGNSKGNLKIDLFSTNGDLLASEQTDNRAPHDWGKYDVTFDSSHEIVSKVVNGSFYRISIVTGGGGGHTLTIKNFDLTALYWVPHQDAFPNEDMVRELKDAQPNILLENKPAETWKVSSSAWVPWRESAPVAKDPDGETRLRMSFEWKDQGYGNSKGNLKIDLFSTNGDLLASEQTDNRAPHDWGKYDVTYDSSHEIVSKAVSGSFYRISIVTGGGGGHTLTIKNFQLVRTNTSPDIRVSAKSLSVSPCTLAVGYLVFDVVCLAVGGVGLRASMNANTARAMAEAVAPAIPRILEIAASINRQASFLQQAKAVFQILSTIWSGGMGGAVLGAFLGSLTWYNAMLYGVTAMGTIVAALATDGAAFIAEVAIELATFAFLVEDAVKAVSACSS